MASLTTGRLAMALSLAVLAMTACGPRNGGSTVAAQCPAQNERYCAAAVGDLLDLPLGELRPTQPSLGYDEVYYRLGRYTLGPDAAHQLLDAWCATNGQKGLRSAKPGSRVADPTSFTCEVPIGSETPATTAPMKTGVIGPGGRVYLTDGHHTLTSFWEAPGGGPGTHIRLKVTGNLSMLEPEAFWREMKDRGWTWLQDANGKPVDPQQLPTSLGLTQFANDPYRGVLYFVRDVGYGQDDNSPAFQEFYWAQWLRARTDPGLQPANFTLTELPSFLTLVGNVATAMVALPGDAEIANSRTADELGKLKQFGQKAFDALSQPLDAQKPGKLTLAITYKNTH